MSLVEEAKRLAPMLAANAAGDDELRRLSDSTWKLLMETGFLRSLQPARFGGGEVSLLEFVDATIEISRASSFAKPDHVLYATDWPYAPDAIVSTFTAMYELHV